MKTPIYLLLVFALSLQAQSAYVDISPNKDLMTIELNDEKDSLIVKAPKGLVSFEMQNSTFHFKILTTVQRLSYSIASLRNGPYSIYVRYKSGEIKDGHKLVNISHMRFLKCPCK